jgi:hypothetical protein
MAKYRTAAQVLAGLGESAHVPLRDLLEFTPGRSLPAPAEDVDLAAAIGRASQIHVGRVVDRSGQDGIHVYDCRISYVRELTRATIQRIIRLGQSAAAAEDSRE